MSIVSIRTTVSLKEAADLSIANYKKIYMYESEPGCGKSSQLSYIRSLLGEEEYSYVYFDMANKDVSDIGLPMPDREKRITEFFLNGIFQHYTGKKLVTIYDEWTKAPKIVQQSLHPSLEVKDPRIGNWFLPLGSIRILTGNQAGDGIGDVLHAHTRQRVTVLPVRKPNAKEWLAWAVNNNIHPIVMAFVDQFPHCLASYTDGGQDNNPYIFNPRKVQGSCISPRTLELVSHSLWNRDKVTPNAMLADMIGTIGEAGARDMEAFIAFQDQLPPRDVILRDPKGAPLPTTPGACAVLVYSAVAALDKNNATPLLTYVERMEPEWQAVFCTTAAKDKNKQSIVFSNKTFANWLQENQDLL